MKQLAIVVSLLVADDENPLRPDFETQIIDALEGSGVKLASANGGDNVALNLFLIPALQDQEFRLHAAVKATDDAAEIADAAGEDARAQTAWVKANRRTDTERALFGFSASNLLHWVKERGKR
jgi:hypothetical protein